MSFISVEGRGRASLSWFLFSKRALASEQGAFLEMSVLSEALVEGNPPILHL